MADVWCATTMDFKVLDIEKEPVKQGFEVGTYDFVFAASVWHPAFLNAGTC